MNRKFFSLIYGNEVHISPNQKVIKEAEFSKLLEGRELLQEIEREALQLKEEVAIEAEKVKELAEQQGFEAGFAKFFSQIAHLEETIQGAKDELRQVIVPLAIKAAQKIVGREIALDPTTIVDIVASNLKAVSQHKKIVIYVNRDELEVIEEHKERLKKMCESLESLSIRPRDDIESGGCSIETEVGIINAQLSNQWLIIENAFQKMLS
ncbi:MAG: Type secretion ATPase inhibitor [Chlamydiales bacterium]|nr:Type secretion ATPase inhibitor [Chlamydiales bacterium]